MRLCDIIIVHGNFLFNRSETCQASYVSNPDVEDTIYDDIDQVICACAIRVYNVHVHVLLNNRRQLNT